jgi:tRNA U38,U39,U40 pseudouridine synthase TruA
MQDAALAVIFIAIVVAALVTTIGVSLYLGRTSVKEKKYVYYVTYKAFNDDSQGNGAAEFSLSRKITGWDAIEVIQRDVKELTGHKNILVTNFIFLREETK